MSSLPLSLFSTELTTTSKNTLLVYFFIRKILYDLTKVTHHTNRKQQNYQLDRNQIPNKLYILPLVVIAKTSDLPVNKKTDQSRNALREDCSVFSALKVYMNFSNRLTIVYGIKFKHQIKKYFSNQQ